MAKGIYLQMTYRRGKAMAGYLSLPRKEGDWAARSREAAPGLVVDYAPDGRPIGIEIVCPSVVSPEAVNALLVELDQQALGEEELAPLLICQAGSGRRPSPAQRGRRHD